MRSIIIGNMIVWDTCFRIGTKVKPFPMMNAIYQIERLPLMVAILIHGSVLYISYLVTYLLNDWLDWDVMPIVVFSAIFLVGYIVIWALIYSITKNRTERLNEALKQKQQNP